MQVIPALIIEDENQANDFEELKNRFEIAKPILADSDNWIQLDITDGEFVPTRTNLSFDEVRYFTERAKVDLHLMTKNPEKNIDEWLLIKPGRITFHIEATDKAEKVIEECRKAGVEVGVALNSETPNSAAESLLGKVDLVLYLGVHPGWSGQKFIPKVLDKIKSLRTGYPNVKIGVDGGINLETAKLCKVAGANVVFSGSYILNSPDTKRAFNELTSL